AYPNKVFACYHAIDLVATIEADGGRVYKVSHFPLDEHADKLRSSENLEKENGCEEVVCY
ncbi:hypothetical protein U1Q18_051602, partial [Sarracenia purpurea var. burkii]